MPFDDLPMEVIQHVFRLCCQTVEFSIPHEPDRSGTTQVTLSLVCSRWREIALNTSALWGDVAVIYAGGTGYLRLVKKWLDRARRTPISLTISVFGKSETRATTMLQTLLSLFHVTNLDLESYNSFLLVPTNNVSHLERLHLSLYEQAQKPFPRLPEMPSLKELHLCLHHGNFADPTNIYLIPWHQLRVFTLSENDWSSHMLFSILQRCQSLVECILLVNLQYGQHEHDIFLPNLDSLVLDMNSEGSADPLMLSLTVPNLRSLDIRCWSRYMKLPLSPEAIVIMAQRSGFDKCLTNLSLCRTEQLVDVSSLLGSMPALKSVHLLGSLMFQPGTFDDLSSGTIGPQLEEIYFGVMSDEEITLLLETVGQRHEKARTVSGIRPFAFITGHCTSESDLEFHEQQAHQCGEAFNADVSIYQVLSEDLLADMTWDSDESDSDFSIASDRKLT